MKRPADTPERDERCCLRGDRSATGVLRKYDPDTEWATVEWDGGVTAPRLVHRFELMRA
jgi:hypothetical protein